METSSSIPIAGMSQASLASESKKQQEVPERSASSQSRTRMGRRTERPVLLDITNDSPIVGLAAGSLKTPSSSVGKSRARAAGRGTPGSGEALLRGQVKTLLQKVDEETELVKLPPSEEATGPFQVLLGHLRSPAGLLAPTPANTPQIVSLPGIRDGGPISAVIIPSAQKDEGPKAPLVEAVIKEEQTPNLHQCLINRALQFDSSEESELSGSSPISFSSVASYQGSESISCPKKPVDDDCSSAWSTQTNPSSREDDYEEEDDCGGVGELGADDEDGCCYDGEEGEAEAEEDSSSLDALCEGMMRMMTSMDQKEVVGQPEFAGKHTRFTYNSDDEMVGAEEEVGVVVAAASPGVLRLRGLPAPEGKHLRFQEGEED